MKAAILPEPLKLEISQSVKVPKPRENEVLVRVRAIGICPSDVRHYKGERPGLVPYGEESYGLLGHEWSGEIVEIGPGVSGIEEGERVLQDHLVPCNRCRYCGMGFTNLCINKRHYLRGYAEYALAYAPNVYKIPDDVTFEEACFAEPLSCVIHAHRIAGIAPGDIVVIIGSGPMGLLHMELAKLSGATVIISDLLDERLSKAKSLGADVVVNGLKEDLAEVVKSLTDGIGADKVIVSIGNKEAIEQSLPLVRKKGTVILFGGTLPPRDVQINPNLIHYGEITITGSADHTRDDFRTAVKLIADKKLRLRELITHELTLDELKEAFEIVTNRKGLKVIIHP